MGAETDRARLLGELYAELRALAERYMRGQPPGHTLQATALVHEACLKLSAHEGLPEHDRARVMTLASLAMRNVLVDHARAKQRVKRSAPGEREPLDGIALAYQDRAVDLLALDEALARLADFDPDMVRVVDLHFFAGLSLTETASLLDLPERTLQRRWAATRAWLRSELG
jgi:RNA polymerase sigma factor (TIGR02999 family)